MTLPNKQNAEVKKLLAEARAYNAEADYHELQAERLRQSREDDLARPEHHRIVNFTSDVTFGATTRAIDQLTQMANKSHDPIKFIICSYGGFVDAGLALFDHIRLMCDEGIEITTIARGTAASMGAVLLQAGQKRLVTPNCSVMIHEITSGAIGKVSELMDELKATERLQDRLLNILAERSTMTKTQIKRRWKKTDWYLDPEETVELGFADAIA